MTDNGLYHVGIDSLIERKKVIINNKEFEYFEEVDVVLGCFHKTKTGEPYFWILSGKYLGICFNSNDVENSPYLITQYENVANLILENNATNFDVLFKKYKKTLGNFYVRDGTKLSMINDNKIIKEIKKSKKDFNEEELDNDADISNMYQSIKKTIISQDEQIMQILTSLFKNQKVINSNLSDDMKLKLKENIIIYGSTGTGKTEILKRIAKIYNVPIVIEDTTLLSETGYVGRDVSEMLKDLYLESGEDIKKAESGILVLDEFDKLAEKNNTGQDHVSRVGVQRSLLKLLDGATFYIDNETFDTSKLSVVALGAFSGISDSDDYSNVTSSDFISYGIIRELMGRFSKKIPMNSLSKDDIKDILIKSDFSPLNTYKLLFESMNIKFSYGDDFIDYIADKAVELKSGARSLKTVVDDEISGAMFRIFAGDYTSIHLTSPNEDNKCYELKKGNSLIKKRLGKKN